MASPFDTTAYIPLVPRLVGILAPTLYTGITADYSFTFVPPIVQHAPNAKTMAKQWFQGYQTGPIWVPPLIMTGTVSNVFLGLTTSTITTTQQNMYLTAAACIFSILPITFLYMEPGINGALKWKCQSLLQDEGFKLAETSLFFPHAHRHGSTMKARRWAEGTEVRELILFWRRVNNVRWVLTFIAAVLSGVATLSQVP